MNELMRELAERAAREHQGPNDGFVYPVDTLIKLVVEECANVCYHHSDAAGGPSTVFGLGYRECGDDIKKTFGIKP